MSYFKPNKEDEQIRKVLLIHHIIEDLIIHYIQEYKPKYYIEKIKEALKRQRKYIKDIIK